MVFAVATTERAALLWSGSITPFLASGYAVYAYFCKGIAGQGP